MKYTIDIEEFSRLIKALYQGILENVPWSGFLDRLQSKLEANYVTIVISPPTDDHDGLFLTTGTTGKDFVASYNSHFYAMDPFVDLPSAKVVSLDEFISSSERVDSEYCRQFLEPMDVFHVLGVDIRTDNGAKYSLRISRGRESSAFNDGDKAFVEMLVPHLQEAIELHTQLGRIETERNLYAGAVNQLAVGTIILDEEAKVLQSNQVASDLLREKDGIELIGGSLQVGSSRDTRRLKELIRDVLAAQNDNQPSVVEALRVQRPSGKSDLGIVVRSVQPSQWSKAKHTPSVVLFVGDPEQQSQVPRDVVKTLFDLTPAEAQLAMILANGLTLDETAEELGISRNTARAHLRSIFSKTGVTRQTMLVRLILKSVATLG